MNSGTGIYHIREHLFRLPGFSLSKKHMGRLKTMVTIGTKTKSGELEWPHIYIIKTKEALQCEIDWVKDKQTGRKTKVYLIPFSYCNIRRGD